MLCLAYRAFFYCYVIAKGILDRIKMILCVAYEKAIEGQY